MKPLVIITAIAALSLAGVGMADAKGRQVRAGDRAASMKWRAGPVSPPLGFRDYLVRSPAFPRYCVSDAGYGRADFSSC